MQIWLVYIGERNSGQAEEEDQKSMRVCVQVQERDQKSMTD